MTLDEMIQTVAEFLNDPITKDGDSYVGDDLEKANKIKDSINYAYMKICREKIQLEAKQVVKNNSNINNFQNEVYKINKVVDSLNNQIPYSIDADIITFSIDKATVYYTYLPEELTGLTVEPEFPRYIDIRGLCYFAAYEYLMGQGIDFGDYLKLWNDFYENIRPRRGNSIKRVINVYD